MSDIFICLCLLSIIFIIVMQSPVDVFSPDGISSTDSSVFQYVARVINNGGLPYKDAFDHKGPLLYLIDALGLSLSKHGIWFIECLFMAASVFGVYKTARMLCNKWQALTTVLILFAPMYDFFEGGNTTEEYTFAFQTWALFIFLDYLINEKISGIRVIICGALLGLTLFIRANMIPVWIVFCIYITFKLLFRKKFRQLLVFIIQFFAGLLSVSVPIILYLTVNSIFGDFIDQYIIFNLIYSANPYGVMLTVPQFSIIVMRKVPAVAAGIIMMILLLILDKRKDRLQLNILSAVLIALSLFMTTMTSVFYWHYGILLIPSLIFPYASFLDLIISFNKDNPPVKLISIKSLTIVVKLMLIIGMIVFLISDKWLGMIMECRRDLDNYKSGTCDSYSREFDDLILFIDGNTIDMDLISVYGNYASVYNASNRFSASVYEYQRPVRDYIPGMIDKYIEDLKNNSPALIIVTEPPDDKTAAFLNCFYTLKAQFGDSFTVYSPKK